MVGQPLDDKDFRMSVLYSAKSIVFRFFVDVSLLDPGHLPLKKTVLRGYYTKLF